MAPSDKNSEAAIKPPAKVQTIRLKVFIHCEGCKKKVKKILQQIDGVTTVDVDAELGTVTVTGTVDSKVLLKKLEKAGKVGEVLAPAGVVGIGRGKEQQKDQAKGEKKEVKKVRFEEDENKDKKGKVGNVVGEGGRKGDSSRGTDHNLSDASSEEIGEKMRVGAVGLDDASSSKNTVHRLVTPRMIETGYSIESADYATHMFSDENTDSCHIM